MVLGILNPSHHFSPTGLSPSMDRLSSTIRLRSESSCRVPRPLKCRNTSGLGCFRFARRYSGNRVFFLFLRVLRWFTSTSLLLLPMYSEADNPPFDELGFPIRTSSDLRLLAASRGFSQLATSFIVSPRQGIHHLLLVA